uniref:Putative secreted protein n=1 Tax=Ixodes ricinus TaxID=34613 RepID=A0A6B0U7X6_IXORI
MVVLLIIFPWLTFLILCLGAWFRLESCSASSRSTGSTGCGAMGGGGGILRPSGGPYKFDGFLSFRLLSERISAPAVPHPVER